MSTRTVKRLHAAVRDDIADLQTRRPLPGPELDALDPFLFLNHHGPQIYPPRNHGLPFGPHPHRGFETVTFIIDGDLLHRDSGGHESVIRAGGVQWMTAGRGLVHAELSSPAFLRDGGPLEILQLWHNLPARHKLAEPRYVGLQADDVPKLRADGATLELVCGTFEGQLGAITPLTDVALAVVRLDEGARVTLPAPHGQSIFCYVVRGEVDAGGPRARAFHLVEFADDGNTVALAAAREAIVLYGHATPYREPVVAYGPFVMNTRQEIARAIDDYQAGRFGAPI